MDSWSFFPDFPGACSETVTAQFSHGQAAAPGHCGRVDGLQEAAARPPGAGPGCQVLVRSGQSRRRRGRGCRDEMHLNSDVCVGLLRGRPEGPGPEMPLRRAGRRFPSSGVAPAVSKAVSGTNLVYWKTEWRFAVGKTLPNAVSASPAQSRRPGTGRACRAFRCCDRGSCLDPILLRARLTGLTWAEASPVRTCRRSGRCRRR